MIDIHAHLCFDDFKGESERIASVCEKEMDAVIVGSARHDEGVRALKLCKSYKRLFPSIGYHPIEGGKDHKKVIDLIRKNASDIVSVGEVGLDYHWEKDEKKRENQKRVFSEFIELAHELGRPLVIHSWGAEEDCFEMVRDAKVPVVFHCYSGSGELAEKIIGKCFFISFSTHILFSKAHRKLAKVVPLGSMLLETDAPFLSPYKYLKGKGEEGKLRKGFDPEKNYPWNIAFSAGKIAKIKSVTADDVLDAADRNARSVFGLVK